MPNAAIRELVIRTSADIPPNLRKVLDDTPIGHLTPPEVTKQGVEMVALCGRKPTTIDTPKRKEMRDKMYAQKYEQTSNAYLDEIRKAAMIEYRQAGAEDGEDGKNRKGAAINGLRIARPLALTLGEPAGIGPDITLLAWLRRDELKLPPFYLLGDARFSRRARAQALGVNVPSRKSMPRSAGHGLRRCVAGRRYGKAGDRRTRPSRRLQRRRRDRLDPAGRRRRARRPCQRRRHQSDREERAL